MSLQPQPINNIPEQAIAVAQAAFPKGVYSRNLSDRLAPTSNRVFPAAKLCSHRRYYDDSCLRNMGLRLLECSTPRGPRRRAFQHLVDAMRYGMCLVYLGQKASTVPVTDHTPTRQRRNEQIRRRYRRGETVMRLATAFDLSEQRIWQILRDRRK